MQKLGFLMGVYRIVGKESKGDVAIYSLR